MIVMHLMSDKRADC